MNKLFRFAHISDVHLGAFRIPALQQLVLQSFIRSLDICIKRRIDFIIIAGDLFDSNLPDMSIVNEAVKKMDEVRRKGVPIYVVYGSHDFSPNQSSIIDILTSASLFQKVTYGKTDEDKLLLKFHIDKKTGAKLVGIHGLKSGTEKQYYAALNREPLEKEEGFKIFVFHGMLTEYKPNNLAEMDSMPISYLPKNFGYYAGGHLHERIGGKMCEFNNVYYPGTLFGADYRDLENSAKGMKRGFYIVSFSDQVQDCEFVEVPSCEYMFLEYNGEGKTSSDIQLDLNEIIKDAKVAGKLVIFKIKGRMSSGRTSDINFSNLVRTLQDKGALDVLMNHSQLISLEYSSIRVPEHNPRDIERRIFKETIDTVKVSLSKLQGNAGITLSLGLLDIVKRDKKHNELKNDYESRIINDGIELMQLTDKLKEN